MGLGGGDALRAFPSRAFYPDRHFFRDLAGHARPLGHPALPQCQAHVARRRRSHHPRSAHGCGQCHRHHRRLHPGRGNCALPPRIQTRRGLASRVPNSIGLVDRPAYRTWPLRPAVYGIHRIRSRDHALAQPARNPARDHELDTVCRYRARGGQCTGYRILLRAGHHGHRGRGHLRAHQTAACVGRCPSGGHRGAGLPGGVVPRCSRWPAGRAAQPA